jgi:hypothetical protein
LCSPQDGDGPAFSPASGSASGSGDGGSSPTQRDSSGRDKVRSDVEGGRDEAADFCAAGKAAAVLPQKGSRSAFPGIAGGTLTTPPHTHPPTCIHAHLAHV